jgi:hypothetical protein
MPIYPFNVAALKIPRSYLQGFDVGRDLFVVIMSIETRDILKHVDEVARRRALVRKIFELFIGKSKNKQPRGYR